MQLFICLLLSFALYFTCHLRLGTGNALPENAPTILVRQGYLKGIKENTLKGNEFYSYKSIPYARPPVGPLRFRPPAPVLFWPGILDATKEPDFCMQKMYVQNVTSEESNTLFYAREDCLYLNVYTPKNFSRSSRYPVMFYIHGGSFIMGGAQKMPPYVLMDEDIVLVVIQYRLGIFGFLSMEDSILPGNMGMKDQQFALKWVKDNIASFGGDPDRITIFGNSAGSAAVHLHILSPGSRGLFNRAIMMSATALSPLVSFNHRNYAIEAGKHFGCTLDFGTRYYMLCMQNVEASELQNFAYSKLIWEYNAVTTLPRVDGDFLPDVPEVLMNDGRYNKVDLMAGITRDESVYMIQLLYEIPNTFEELQTEFDFYGPVSLAMDNEPNPEALAHEAYQHYLQKDVAQIILEEDAEDLLKLYSDRHINFGYDLTIQFLKKRQDISLYLYHFEYVGQFTTYDYDPALRDRTWAAHTDDLLYLFAGGPIVNINMIAENDLKVREFMVTSWTNFARTGNPTPEGSSIVWNKANKHNMHQLAISEQPKMITYNYTETRQFWASLDTWQNRLLSEIGYTEK